ncbi:hypothetical protein AALP_AA8G517400 [Arabis alpina]|uniref:Agenet domain-containing protein n=1 Tax=Arabis alpina TaxID=50452 RepID=A0A087GF12_ARAAL|nr:hypothetical protein AALP_AA8G517400 [Arabis alpina]
MLKSNESSEEIMMKDTEVEVCSEEEGFEGAWFRAILEENTTTRRRKRIRVRYLSLLSEDGSSPLVEHIEQRFIRPVPLEKDYEGMVLEEGVFVDAYWKDGYWTGFVVKTLKDDNFLVSFDKPVDILQFERKLLRVHLHWNGLEWKQPQKMELSKSMFSPGTKVEVRSLINTNEVVWTPAMVIKEIEVDVKKKLIVKEECSDLSSDGDEAKTNPAFYVRYVRPTPPHFSVEEYSLMQTVEAFHDFIWRRGRVRKILYDKSYTVGLVDTNKEYEFQHSDLRPFKVWEDGVWCDGPKHKLVIETPSSVLIKQSLNPEESGETLAKAKTVSFNGALRMKNIDAVMKDTTFVARTPQVISIANESVSPVTPSPIITTTPETQEKTSPEETFQLMRNHNGLSAADSTKEKVMGSPQMNGDATPVIIPQAIPIETVPPVTPVVHETPMKEPEAKTQGNAFPEKSLHNSLAMDSTGKKMSAEQNMKKYTRKRKRGQEHDSNLDEAGKGCNGSKELITDTIESDDDQPLSAWILGGKSPSGSLKSKLSSGQCLNTCTNSSIDETRANEDTTMVLPFVKHSPLWKAVESLEVFKSAKQRPHFSPVLNKREEFREGLAMGAMVNFSALLQRVNKLQFDTPQSTLESLKECFFEIEEYGFDVKAPLSRINLLFSLKDSQMSTMEEIKAKEREMVEDLSKKQKREEDLRELRRQIVDLEKKKKAMEKKIAEIQSCTSALDSKMQDMELEFTSIVSAPW